MEVEAANFAEKYGRKMRILLYTAAFYPKVDGISLRVRHLLVQLKKMGYEVIVLCPYEKAPDVFEGIPILKLPSFQPLNYTESKLAYPLPIFTLLRIFNQFRPDLVHVVGPEFVFIPIRWICWLYGVPLLGSYHFYIQAWLEYQPKWTQMTMSWLLYLERTYNWSDYVITPSTPMKNILNSKGMKCNDVWPPAVDSQVFNPKYKSMEIRNELTFGHPNAPIILYVGRLAQEKSLDLLPKILEAHKTAHIAIVGGGQLAPEWKARHGERNRIYCLGEHWTGEKLSTAYASADIFILPSSFEALGNVILEAMASQVAVVGCNAGGIPHMIKHRENGLLFEPYDGDGLATAVVELIQNDTLRNELALAGREYAEGISWEAAGTYVAEIYERVYQMRKEGKTVNKTEKFPAKTKPTLFKSFFKLILYFLLLIVFIHYFFGNIFNFTPVSISSS